MDLYRFPQTSPTTILLISSANSVTMWILARLIRDRFYSVALKKGVASCETHKSATWQVVSSAVMTLFIYCLFVCLISLFILFYFILPMSLGKMKLKWKAISFSKYFTLKICIQVLLNYFCTENWSKIWWMIIYEKIKRTKEFSIYHSGD